MSDRTSGPFGWLTGQAAEREAAGLRRTLRPRPARSDLLDLASNDYLDLARDPRVTRAAAAAAVEWGAGSTGSRLVTGSTLLHAELEAALAGFVGTPAGLVLSSGFLANQAAVVALSGPGTLVVSDADNHASIVDACRLSRARVAVVPHRDVAAVAAALAGRDEPRALVVTDGVFSVDGERAPLAELMAVARRHGAGVVVDEAHALGVVGPGGRGCAAAAGLAGAPDVVLTVTLSKALGAQGGAVLASRSVVDHLVDTARGFVFDTALAPPAVGAALAALGVLVDEPGLPEQVRARAADLAAAARSAGWRPAEPEAAVVGVPVGDPLAAVRAQHACAGQGVAVGCFRPPSVPDGRSRLRLTARAGLTDDDVARAAAALRVASQQ